jgi:hypothetical protein
MWIHDTLSLNFVWSSNIPSAEGTTSQTVIVCLRHLLCTSDEDK